MRMYPAKIVYLVSFVASFLPATFFGQTGSHPPAVCTPSALDVSALPPAQAAESPNFHLFVLELQNVGTSACTLPGPQIDLLPKSDTNNNPYFADDPDSSGRHPEYLERQLSPGDWVHLLVGWVSRDAPEIQCDQYSGLRLALPGEPSVEVRNLWIRSCFHVNVSAYRPGKYTPSSGPPTRWWACDCADASINPTFPSLATSSRMLDDYPLLQLHAPAKRAMLGDSLQLRLKFPRQADDSCAFRLLRKRESTGVTIISVQQCAETKALQTPATPQSLEAGVLRLTLQNMDLLPTHFGPLQYDVVARISDSTFARAHFDLLAHDPTPPSQAAILSSLPECSGSQLKLANLPPIVADRLRTLRVYQATNISTAPCSLAGVPTLRFLDEKGANQPFVPRPCPNCANDLFAPRPNGRIDLQAGEPAHFLVAATAIDTKEDPWMYCPRSEMLELRFESDSTVHPLPFAAQDCATTDVSAWRLGTFDGDPLNLRWARVHDAETSSADPTPPDCNKPELLAMGQPHMTSLWQQLQIGLSIASRNFVAGQEVPLHIWLDNTSNETVSVMSCSGLDYFKAYGFDLYDGYGHRVLRKREIKQKEQCKTNPHLTDIWVCSMNVLIPIPAHSCVTGSGYLYTAMLSELYDLPPGEYTVHPHEYQQIAEDLCKAGQEAKPFQRNSADITFSINQP